MKGHSHTLPRNVSLQAVMLTDLSCQQPPLFSRHSFVSISSLKQTAGSVVSSKPEQIAFSTAALSNFPRYWRLLTTSVGNMVTSPLDPLPIWASCSSLRTGFSASASGSPIHFSICFMSSPNDLTTPSAQSLLYFLSFMGHLI
uniref:Uncharacterized protein n=1 Tax=Opuntia streptacantha TaxID=393608 RepID=A0A7C8Z664_OPUST